VSKVVGIIVNREKKDALNYAFSIIEWLEKRKIQVLVTRWGGGKINRDDLIADKDKIGKRAELIVSLGGDGTLCRAARDFAPYDIPLWKTGGFALFSFLFPCLLLLQILLFSTFLV